MAISKFNYNSFNVTPVAGRALAFDADADGFTTASGSSMILIKTLTASSSATLDFVDGTSDVVLDDTYPVYKFEFINIHAATDQADFNFQVNVAGASGFNETITSTHFGGYHRSGDGASQLGYQTGGHQAQGTSYQRIFADSNNGNTDSSSGHLYLFNPSSTTFVTHFMARTVGRGSDTSDPSSTFYYTGGYVNATAAVDEVSFKMSSGNIDAGIIKLYGIADS